MQPQLHLLDHPCCWYSTKPVCGYYQFSIKMGCIYWAHRWTFHGNCKRAAWRTREQSYLSMFQRLSGSFFTLCHWSARSDPLFPIDCSVASLFKCRLWIEILIESQNSCPGFAAFGYIWWLAGASPHSTTIHLHWLGLRDHAWIDQNHFYNRDLILWFTSTWRIRSTFTRYYIWQSWAPRQYWEKLKENFEWRMPDSRSP